MTLHSQLYASYLSFRMAKRFICDTCGKSFKTGQQLRRHSVVHTKTKAYECMYCSKRYARDDRFSAHVKKCSLQFFMTSEVAIDDNNNNDFYNYINNNNSNNNINNYIDNNNNIDCNNYFNNNDDNYINIDDYLDMDDLSNHQNNFNQVQEVMDEQYGMSVNEIEQFITNHFNTQNDVVVTNPNIDAAANDTDFNLEEILTSYNIDDVIEIVDSDQDVIIAKNKEWNDKENATFTLDDLLEIDKAMNNAVNIPRVTFF